MSATIHVPEVSLALSKKKMTLKHDNLCELNVVTKPAAPTFTDHKIKIAFSNKQMEFTLANGTNYSWTIKVAGNFRLYAQATADGTVYDSTNAFATVQFPHRDDIAADAGVVSAMEAAWQKTLLDSTPTGYQERSFVIYLDTRTDTYATGSHDESGLVAPDSNITWLQNGLIEPDIPQPISSGLTYPVGTFHTHTPEEYSPITYVRDVGPLGKDVGTANSEKTPGFVYDYNVGPIWGGHAETNNAKIYPYGPERKAVPVYE